MTEVTLLEQLPKAVGQIQQDIDTIKRLILERGVEAKSEGDQPMTVEQCAKFLNLSKATIYTLISQRKIPVMKRGKRCYFSKLELLEYLKAGRKKTVSEIEEEADQCLSKE